MKAIFVLMLGFLLVALACSDDGDPVSTNGGGDGGGNGGGNGGDSTTVSFADDVQPIFNASCGGSSCHGASGGAGGLVMAGVDAYDNLVDIVSNGYDPAVRVVAGDPSNSVLYGKVTGDSRFGQAMPLGRSFSDSARETIRKWIEEGAKDN